MNLRRPVTIAATLALHAFVLAGIVAWSDKPIEPGSPAPISVALIAAAEAGGPTASPDSAEAPVPESETLPEVPEVAAAPAPAEPAPAQDEPQPPPPPVPEPPPPPEPEPPPPPEPEPPPPPEPEPPPPPEPVKKKPPPRPKPEQKPKPPPERVRQPQPAKPPAAETPAPPVAVAAAPSAPAQPAASAPPAAPASANAPRDEPGPIASAPRTSPKVDASWSGNRPPPYPRLARRLGHEGVVLLDVRVEPSGRVSDVRLKKSSGSDLLDRTAIDTVREWRFQPATVDGTPVAEWYRNWNWIFELNKG